MARGKEYAPTDEEKRKDQALVVSQALIGTPHKEIARLVGVSLNTLKKYFKEELSLTKAQAIANVGASLYHQAMSGNVVAAIFYLKTQAGWRETGMTEDASRPLPVIKYAERK